MPTEYGVSERIITLSYAAGMKWMKQDVTSYVSYVEQLNEARLNVVNTKLNLST